MVFTLVIVVIHEIYDSSQQLQLYREKRERGRQEHMQTVSESSGREAVAECEGEVEAGAVLSGREAVAESEGEMEVGAVSELTKQMGEGERGGEAEEGEGARKKPRLEEEEGKEATAGSAIAQAETFTPLVCLRTEDPRTAFLPTCFEPARWTYPDSQQEVEHCFYFCASAIFYPVVCHCILVVLHRVM